MKKTWMLLVKLFIIAGVLVTGGLIMPSQLAYAATAVKVVKVEYYEEQIVVKNNDNTKISFATDTEAARNSWEVIDADSGDYTTIDMSWLSASSENIIMVKGNNDTTVSRVVMRAKPSKLSVSISYEKLDDLNATDNIASLVNIMASEGTGKDPIDFDDLEWKKGETGIWKDTDELTAALLEKFLVKGTTLHFRIRAEDDVVGAGKDSVDGTAGRRFSSEVKVKITKKPVASGYGIDGSRFTAAIKYGKEYRVTIAGKSSDWIKVTDRTVKSTPLSDLVKAWNTKYTTDAIGDKDGTKKDKSFPKMTIEVRNYATSKSAASKITTTTIEAQRTISEDAIDPLMVTDEDIFVSYNGNKNVVLRIPSASSSQPYEYTIGKPGVTTLDLSKATWTAVTKGNEVKILATKAVNGSTLYIRKKEIKAKNATSTSNAVGYELASTYVSTKIAYPFVPEIVDKAYVFTKNYSPDLTFTVTLNSPDNKDAFEQKIKSIKIGTTNIEFEQTLSTDGNGIQTIAVTIKKDILNKLANCYVKPLTITYENGTIDKTSIKLTVQNATAAGVLTATHAKATNTTGATAFTIITAKGSNTNKWFYVVTDNAISGVNTLDKISDKTTATQNSITAASVDDLVFTAGKYLTIFEVDASDYILRYKSVQITADYIK